jgi:polyphosphate kinase 2 (PPK2 family)
MLETVDLTLSLDKEEYRRQLIELQLAMRELARWLYTAKRSMVLVCEGWDAAGKGGAIRRLTEKVDPRGFEVFPIAAPAGEDKSHHYLWRFWRRLLPPQDKQILIFDRSWYGRVLVERIEGFAAREEWQRAYREINDFERQLHEAGIVLGKFWFHVSREEQLRRFQARELTPHKTWKLTDEDWRNRDKWDVYEEAVQDMLLKTSTLQTPWTVVEGEDKRWARVRFLRTVVDAIAAEREAGGSKPRRKKRKKKKNKKPKR